jgi:molecular chaperone IbpA
MRRRARYHPVSAYGTSRPSCGRRRRSAVGSKADAVGFDRLFDMLDQVNFEPMTNWPPYNVEKQGDDQYRITMAVAGFFPEDIEVTQQENTLVISGKKHQDNGQGEIMHRGIATRAFKHSFGLADFVKMTEAKLENGLLTVELSARCRKNCSHGGFRFSAPRRSVRASRSRSSIRRRLDGNPLAACDPRGRPARGPCRIVELERRDDDDLEKVRCPGDRALVKDLRRLDEGGPFQGVSARERSGHGRHYDSRLQKRGVEPL